MDRLEAVGESQQKRREAHLAFAGRLITLSSGALTLSIAFRGSFSAAVPIHLWLLRVSWIAFTVTIITALIVELGNIKLHTNMVNALLQAAPNELVRANSGCLARPASILMLISFGVAITSLASFALYNLK